MQTIDYEESVKKEIIEVFALARKLDPSMLALPIVDGRTGRKKQVSFVSEVMDKQQEKKVHEAMLLMLSKSNCPYVMQWVQSMIDDHFNYWGQELADIERGADE